MDSFENDYDRIAKRISEIILLLASGTFAPVDGTNGITMEQHKWMTLVVELGRLNQWVNGLANSHREYANDNNRD